MAASFDPYTFLGQSPPCVHPNENTYLVRHSKELELYSTYEGYQGFIFKLGM